MKKIVLLVFFSCFLKAQNTAETLLRGGELLVTGISIIKASKASNKVVNNKIVATVCIKNKLLEKITVKLSGKDEAGEAVIKELVVQNDGKECVFEIPKGIYTYEIVLPSKEVYQKGEYKFEEEITITVKKD